MFQGLQESQLAGALEALLFVTDERLALSRSPTCWRLSRPDVERALVGLRTRFEGEERGVQLREVAGGWRLYTHPVYHELVEKYVLSWDTRKLSQAAMETLAIVAYSQPVTRAGVASVRGVNSDSSINSLVEKASCARRARPTRRAAPPLYATTRAFLEKFDLRSVADLPDLDQFAPDDDTRAFIRERLSATREPVRVAEDVRIGGAEANASDDDFDGVEFDFDGEGEAAVTLGEQLGGSAGAGAGQTLFARMDEAAEDAAARRLKACSPRPTLDRVLLVEKIDFDSLTFETEDE